MDIIFDLTFEKSSKIMTTTILRTTSNFVCEAEFISVCTLNSGLTHCYVDIACLVGREG